MCRANAETVSNSSGSAARSSGGAVILLALVLFAGACTQTSRPSVPRAGFATPQEAVDAIVECLRAGDTPRLASVIGPGSEAIISSGDPVADRQRLQRFLMMYEQKHQLVNEAPDRVTVSVGDSDWPLPIPLVKRSDRWVFDVEAGAEEILNRRIGQNELNAIQVCRAIADAQREYAQRDPNGDGASEYAQRFASDPGKRNGLYWLTMTGEQPSPLGVFAAKASAEGYRRSEAGPTPYHGYYYRILTAQGADAPGGELSYIINGRMALGYAVVAYPAEYGNSGIMTFIMGQDGVVYQKNLGATTAETAAAMKVFDPDPSWTKAE